MSDINELAQQYLAEKRQQALADSQSAGTTSIPWRLIPSDDEVSRLCQQFYRWAKDARPPLSMNQANIRGWTLGRYHQNPNAGSEPSPYDSLIKDFVLVVTTSGKICTAEHNRGKRANSLLGREYIVHRRPDLSVFRSDDIRRTIAKYVAEAGIPWPY